MIARRETVEALGLPSGGVTDVLFRYQKDAQAISVATLLIELSPPQIIPGEDLLESMLIGADKFTERLR
jgi:hypothetical protein